MTGSARAQLFIATPPGEPAVEHAELAYALGDGPPVTWLSLRLARGPVAVVAALNDGVRVAAGLDAWFEALETTASPHVLLPKAGTDCGESPSLVHVSWPRAQSNPATELSVGTAQDVATVLEAVGVSLTSELPGATSYVVWSWPDTGQPQTTRALRAVGGAAPLELSPGGAFPVLLSAITRGAQTYRNEIGKQALDVTFVAGSRRSSDYRARLADFLLERPEPILETRERGMLFDWSIYDDVLSVAPLVHAYATRADLPEVDAAACSEQLVALRMPESEPATACADAVDAGLAFAAVAPDLATLQRLALSSAVGVSPALFAGGGQASAPLLRAKQVDDTACPKAESEPPIVVVPPARSGGGETAPAPVVVEERVVVEREPVEVDCGGSPQPEPAQQDDYYDDSDDDVDCSSDTSSSSDDEAGDEVACGSDSSSSSESDDTEVDCSSDSSESSDTSDSGCSGDTTSDESGGYDGDTCSGQAAPRAEAPRAQQAAFTGASPPARRSAGQPRPRRLKTSLWSVALAALVLPIRRRKRGQSAGG